MSVQVLPHNFSQFTPPSSVQCVQMTNVLNVSEPQLFHIFDFVCAAMQQLFERRSC